MYCRPETIAELYLVFKAQTGYYSGIEQNVKDIDLKKN